MIKSTLIGGGKTLVISLLISGFSYAQNQQNQIDTVGNIGVEGESIVVH